MVGNSQFPRPSADRLFKDYSRYFNLEHLWFLWYLLVFVTIAPVAAKLFSWISAQMSLDAVDRFGRGLIRFNVMALALGLATLPYLMWWIQPARTAWWGASFAGMVVVTGVALVLFELIVRPTPLVYVFGPPSSRRSSFK